MPSIDASDEDTRASSNNDIVTEDFAALEFVAERGSTLRYCHSTGAWFCWNGNIWSRDEKYVAFHWAREMIRKLVQDESPRIRAISSKVSFCAGVEKFSQRDPAVAVTIDNWDHDEWLLGTPAGTIDLRTGKLRPSDPKDGITKTTPVSPPDDSGCPLWLKFLNETTDGDQELIRFLQQWMGYCLTGSIREHAFVFRLWRRRERQGCVPECRNQDPWRLCDHGGHGNVHRKQVRQPSDRSGHVRGARIVWHRKPSRAVRGPRRGSRR